MESKKRSYLYKRRYHDGSPVKGAATTTAVLMVFVLLATLFFVYMYMVDKHVNSSIQLNLESLEILKLKSTFGLFNTSLGTTWFISTVQAVFQTADEGIGCGNPADQNVVTDEGYWLQTRPAERDTPTTMENGQLVERIPSAEKYNKPGRNPQICYPRDEHVIEWLNRKIIDGNFLRLWNPDNGIDAGGVKITLLRKPDGTVNTDISWELKESSIESRFKQNVNAEFGHGRINKDMENQNIVITSLKRMVAAGRSVVESMLLFGDAFYGALDLNRHYRSLAVPLPDNKDTYQTRISNIIKNTIKQESEKQLPADVFPYVSVETELLAPSSSGIMQRYLGLVLRYKATVRYVEGTSTSIPVGTLQWPTDSRALNSCFGLRKLPEDDLARFHEGVDIRPLDATIDEPVRAADSGVVVDVHNGCSSVGSLDPGSYCRNFGNNRGYGNFVLIRHDNGLYTLYAHLKKGSIAVTPGQSVSAEQQIAVMSSSGHSKGTHLHFEVRTDAAAGSQLDPCNYINCMESTEKTCAFVSVTGTTIAGRYYYHDVETNTFKRRPITLEYVIEDYVTALACKDWSPDPPAAVTFTWRSSNDMACCAGYLFFCAASSSELPAGAAQEQVIPLNSRTSDDVAPQSFCNGVLRGNKLECTAAGFRTTGS